MMAPSATSPVAPAKTGAFDLATLFVADKAVRDESALGLAAAVKKEGVEFLASIQFNDAIVKVSLSSQAFDHLHNLDLTKLTTRPVIDRQEVSNRP